MILTLLMIIIKENPIIIEKNCWIGTGAIILPGVHLKESTIVAGAVVTKSFNKGKIIIAGNPAKIINKINEKITSNMIKGIGQK